LNKTLNILSGFDESLNLRFDKFINSEFFECQNYIKNFYYELIKFKNKNELLTSDKKLIFNNLYPGIKYKDTTFRKLSSELLKHIKKFLSYLEYENELYTSKINFSKQLKKRGFNEYALLELNKTEKEITNDVYSIKNLYNDFTIAMEEMTTPLKSIQFDELKHINKVEKKLITYTFIEFLDFYSHLLHQSKYIHKQTHNYYLLKPVLDFLKKHKNYIDNPYVILFYYKILIYTDQENISNYNNLKNLYFELLNRLNKTTINNIFAVLHSYINEKILEGDKKFLKDKGELFSNVLFQNNISLNINFVLIFLSVETFLQLKDFNKAEKIIEKFSASLPVNLKKDSINLCNAAIHFYKNEFGKTLELLSRIRSNEYFFNMKIKDFQLLIYIQTKSWENALSLIKTYKVFLKKNSKLADSYKLPPLNFCKACEYLIKMEVQYNSNLELKFVKLIKNNKYIAYKWWLEKKFKELNNNDKKNNKFIRK